MAAVPTLFVVQKTAATFAPRGSTASKNPAVPGSTLYTIFEVQAYALMLAGGALSFNLIFPSNEPDLWRLMGMWSIWMFTIPSLRACDCSKNEKEALNYLFLLVPLLNVTIPFFLKSFPLVWFGDTAYLHISVAFIQMLKALMPVATLIMAVLCVTDKLRWDVFLNMLLVSVGVVVSSYGEIYFNVVGTLYQVTGIFAEALRHLCIFLCVVWKIQRPKSLDCLTG